MSTEELTSLYLSLKVAFCATLFSFPIAVLLAFVLARKEFWGKPLLHAAIHLPLLMPPVATGYMLLLAFGKKGFIGTSLWDWFGFTFAFRWTGAALAAGLMALPLFVQTIRVAMETADHRLEGAAATLGASPLRRFFTITVPLAMPGILAGALICFVKALGEFGATITFVSNIPGETQTLALAIYSFLQTPAGDSAAFRLIGLSIVLAFSALLLADYVSRAMQKRLKG
ncbi:molybdate ABC transporter permease subunit [Aestuariivirga litoralis]|uniref:molybdate ABC transporter permease subunit n=1 Tax=Aestuariivirga litoralis TaxID=2650924 RepID=UPI0018C51FB2|nr:molybdate ABC transporter permease subunit [Aestuariivirga litoralis]